MDDGEHPPDGIRTRVSTLRDGSEWSSPSALVPFWHVRSSDQSAACDPIPARHLEFLTKSVTMPTDATPFSGSIESRVGRAGG